MSAAYANGRSTAAHSPRLLYLMNDFVVQEHVCNLRCDYCLNFENEHLKPSKPWVPLERVDLRPDGYGWHRARQVLQSCRADGDAPILRLSGGEIMAIPGSLDFLAEVAPEWDRIQVLTNATFLRRDIDRLSRMPSINLCCSVDGHTPALNALRTSNHDWGQRIVDGLLAAVEHGVPVEVYTVLTACNTDALYDFACFLAALPRTADLRLLPFPVRGNVANETSAAPEQYASVARLLKEYERLAPILPPRAYLQRLYDFCRGRRRANRCRVPLSFMQTFDDGVLASCSNCWTSPLGNILNDTDVFKQVGRAQIHRLFLHDPPRFSFCLGCFTPFDIVNVYLDGDCTIEEITAMDLYSSPAVRRRLIALKDVWHSGSKEAMWELMLPRVDQAAL
jgi:molybdenum cofactor biosynthesis enzyme MoaA